MEQDTANLAAKPADILRLALWFGLTTGLLEAIAYLGFQSMGWIVWQQQINPVDENILWASPLMDVIVFLAFGTALALLARILPRLPWIPIATGVFAFLGSYALLSVSGRLRERAAIALAVGLAAVAARWIKRSPQVRLTALRRSTVWLLAVTVAAGAGGSIWMEAREQVLLSQLPPPSGDRPNVLLIVLDTLRSDRLGAYGYPRPTSPFLDRFARESVQFDAAFSTSSWTLPSHASMFTGRLPNEHGAVLFPTELRHPTLAEILANHGYATAGFVSNKSPLTKAFGLADGFHRWENLFFGAYDAASRTLFGRKIRRYFTRGIKPQAALKHMPAPEVSRRFLNWLDSRPNRPFFAFLNFMEMHEYSPPHAYARRFSPDPESITPSGDPLFFEPAPYESKEDKLLTRADAYDAALAYLDAQLELLFQELERRGLDKNLLVVITSDHGESLGEHGLEEHRNSLYRDQIQIPLLIRFDGRTPKGTRVAATVGIERLPATILELAQIQNHQIPRRSLVPFWSQPETAMDLPCVSMLTGGDWQGVQPHAPIREGNLKSLVEGQWHLIVKENGETELFDWRADPEEENDLADDADFQDLLLQLRAKLEELTQTDEATVQRSARIGS